MSHSPQSKRGSNTGRAVFLTLFSTLWVAPIASLLWKAFTQGGAGDLSFSFAHFEAVFANRDFLRALFNSTVIGVLSTRIIVILAVPAAFICAARDFHGRELLEGWILSTRMMPALVVVLPFFLMTPGAYRNIQCHQYVRGPCRAEGSVA